MDKDAKIIPVIDCPVCGAEDVLLSFEATMSKKGHQDIEIWTCSQCGKVPNVGSDIKVKHYISMADLEAMGYKSEISNG